MSVGRSVRGRLFGAAACLSWAALLAFPDEAPALRGATASDSAASVSGAEVPEILAGDTWLRHHRDDLMPYWDMPSALGTPVGNFPSFRGRDGELLPPTGSNAIRGLSTLARQVYGYSLAFTLTGEERYLTYASAGIDWINAKAKDPVYGGYFGQLKEDGTPVNPLADKEVFDLASLGLAYGMYFNVTRDPAVESDLLAVRDLIFDRYYDPVGNRVKDALTYDLATEVDLGANGGDITNLLVPGTALLLPNVDLLTDPARRAQFRGDLRKVTDSLIARHKNTASATQPVVVLGTHRAVRQLRSERRPPSGTTSSPTRWSTTRTRCSPIARGPHSPATVAPFWGVRGTTRPPAGTSGCAASRRVTPSATAPGGCMPRPTRPWPPWISATALRSRPSSPGVRRAGSTCSSTRESPARETFARISRNANNTDLRKSFFGKNMLHAHEHALIMYLHGRALEGRPARLFYAFPEGQALTAVAKPYWFDAAGETRVVDGAMAALPGHRLVEVEFSGIGAVPPPPYPAPDDITAPTTLATASPAASSAGWHNSDVTVTLAAADDTGGVGVKEIHASVTERDGAVRASAVIDPGEELVLPSLSAEGEYDVTFFAVDRLGNQEPPQTLTVRIDRTSPVLAGLPTQPCVIWPPNAKLVHVADVVGSDVLSGLANVSVTGTASEPAPPRDIVIAGGSVSVRAIRDDEGPGRIYTLLATVTDRAGNATTQQASCLVPHDRGRG